MISKKVIDLIDFKKLKPHKVISEINDSLRQLSLIATFLIGPLVLMIVYKMPQPDDQHILGFVWYYGTFFTFILHGINLVILFSAIKTNLLYYSLPDHILEERIKDVLNSARHCETSFMIAGILTITAVGGFITYGAYVLDAPISWMVPASFIILSALFIIGFRCYASRKREEFLLRHIKKKNK